MSNYFELHNVCAKGVKKRFILSTNVEYIEYNRKTLPTNIVKFNQPAGRCQKGFGNVRDESRMRQEIDFDSMIEQLQTDYL